MVIFISFCYIPILSRKILECLAVDNIHFYIFTVLKVNRLVEHNFLFKRNLWPFQDRTVPNIPSSKKVKFVDIFSNFTL